MNNQKTKISILLLVLISIISVQHIVIAEEITNDIKWVLVGDSPLLDRSSKYLFNGRTAAGIRYAKKALARSQSKYGQVIAEHNLCMAYRSQGELQLAEQHCNQVHSMPVPEASLKEIKAGLYKVKRRSRAGEDSVKLDAVIANNLQIETFNSTLPRIARSE